MSVFDGCKKISKNSPNKVILRFAKGDIKADVADSFLRRTIGLSFRRSLPDKEGRFFIFPPSAAKPIFWNFGMRFPIDVVWLNGGKIVGIEKNIPQIADKLKIFYPPAKADSALEIPTGFADAVGAEIGGIIDIIYESRCRDFAPLSVGSACSPPTGVSGQGEDASRNNALLYFRGNGIKNNFIFAIALFSACVLAVAAFYILHPTLETPNERIEIEIGGNVFFVEIADTDDKKARGLSNRKSLPENAGMLFVFEEPSEAGFWMKDMKFPIDIIWMRESKVIGFVENAKPEPGIPDARLTVYSPPSPIDMALEVPAGTVGRKNIRAGDRVSLPLFFVIPATRLVEGLPLKQAWIPANARNDRGEAGMTFVYLG